MATLYVLSDLLLSLHEEYQIFFCHDNVTLFLLELFRGLSHALHRTFVNLESKVQRLRGSEMSVSWLFMNTRRDEHSSK
jgi:hypothetical protein